MSVLTVSLGKDLVDVSQKLGIIPAIKQKLVAQPDPALDKLVTALEELSKIYDVLQSEVKNLLSLDFDPSPTQEARLGCGVRRDTPAKMKIFIRNICRRGLEEFSKPDENKDPKPSPDKSIT